MKTELDTLRERGAQLIRTADPASVIFSPKHGEALCAFIVDALETQRKLAEQTTASNGQIWGTTKQIAARLGMDSSHVSGMLTNLAANGKIRFLKPDAIPGKKMLPRYNIQDVEALLTGTTPANDRKEPRKR